MADLSLVIFVPFSLDYIRRNGGGLIKIFDLLTLHTLQPHFPAILINILGFYFLDFSFQFVTECERKLD